MLIWTIHASVSNTKLGFVQKAIKYHDSTERNSYSLSSIALPPSICLLHSSTMQVFFSLWTIICYPLLFPYIFVWNNTWLWWHVNFFSRFSLQRAVKQEKIQSSADKDSPASFLIGSYLGKLFTSLQSICGFEKS